MDRDFTLLCTYFFLKEEIKKCEEFDGWSKEDQTEYYIKNTGFNPFIELQKCSDELLEKYSQYLTSLSIDFILNDTDNYDFSTELILIISDINIQSLDNYILVIKFLFDLYFTNKH